MNEERKRRKDTKKQGLLSITLKAIKSDKPTKVPLLIDSQISQQKKVYCKLFLSLFSSHTHTYIHIFSYRLCLKFTKNLFHAQSLIMYLCGEFSKLLIEYFMVFELNVNCG